MRPWNRVLPMLALIIPLALLAGCGGAAASADASRGAGPPVPGEPAPGPVSLSESGSTLLYPLLRSWASAYHRKYAQVTVTTAATGSGKGIAGASAGTVSIGASDAFLSSGDLVKNPALLNIPLVISAQQINYNLPGLRKDAHVRLNGAVLAKMYSGQITSWNDPAITAINPGVSLPGTRVVPLHRAESSGDTFLFTSYLATDDPGWNAAIGYGTTVAWPATPAGLAEHGNSGMVSGCEATPGCVAYVGISYLSSALAGGLGEAQLANGAGQYELPTAASIGAAVAPFISQTPTNETISMVNGPAADGYPIVNYEYAIVSRHQPDPVRARDIRAFLHWAITSGNTADYLGPVQFQPLPGDLVTLSDEQISKIGAAS